MQIMILGAGPPQPLPAFVADEAGGSSLGSTCG
jgi:hypothetical protein